MSTPVQSRVFGEAPATFVEIESTADVLRRALALPSELVNGARLECDGDAIHTDVVDPANVAVASLRLPADTLEQYAIAGGDAVTIGANLEGLTGALSRARLGADDAISCRLDATTALVMTEREYETTTLEQTTEVRGVDPDAVREADDTPEDIRGLQDWAVTVDVAALSDAIDAVPVDYVELEQHDGDFYLTSYSSKDTKDSAIARFDTEVEALGDDPNPDATSLLSLDYVEDAVAGFKTARVGTVTVRWGDEVPVIIDGTREKDGETLYELAYGQAPRLKRDGDSE